MPRPSPFSTLVFVFLICAVATGVTAGERAELQPSEAFRGVLLQLADHFGEKGLALRDGLESLTSEEMAELHAGFPDPEVLAAEVDLVVAAARGGDVEKALGAVMVRRGLPGPGGEIPEGPFVGPGGFTANLNGSQEVPPVPTFAIGFADIRTIRILGFGFLLSSRWDLFMTGPLLPVAFETGAHMHLGMAGENGPVILPLRNDPTLDLGLSRFTLELHNEAELINDLAGLGLDELEAEINAGNVYINLHTELNPSGEIRGQVQ